MSVPFDHRDPGTSEDAWQRAAPWRGLPALDLTGVERLVVLSAHPDDETLGAGGLIFRAARDGVAVSVIVVTDGDAAHPDVPNPADLGRVRREELIRALHELAPGAPVDFLGVADGGIREARADVAAALSARVRGRGSGRTLIAAPWWDDGHRDHRVLGEIALSLRTSGATVVGYPIWLWHWGDPASIDTVGWRAFSLDEESVAAKSRAIAAHRSQLHPDPDAPADGAILHADTKAHFARDVEVLIAPSPTRDDRETPEPSVADFDAFHERHDDPWGLESRWYERRKRDLLLASLPRERFARALELGCAGGATSRELASRASSLVAVDASEVALSRARRNGAPSNVRFEQWTLPDEWPAGDFDLIVLSELGYYWSAERLARALDRIDASAAGDAVLVACHWRHPIDTAPLGGDDVHAAIAARREWTRAARHIEDDFVLDVLARGGAASVARETGVL
ncbi:bifunctional PIG-L family deacetylase/class I SAM-dependent methyltransferase [Microbacterium betulae]|uniref:Bifunctional PIG-L family deacetylase/class I SAM-dependent methyltransferase n=1 Tax=Microbacterium betulae TaxID=2981139 RepID=A0AA97FJL4_9MICO|nr:bifunctional PIG-L family deacetylase/class I SAM-dependent methyltransferase [Microbacterium sp. AB]WOF23944.1 bifunctional PIG-L family deacetylase/class I SAM-dependent methyltransferase [Microbacterium sp. AB]